MYGGFVFQSSLDARSERGECTDVFIRKNKMCTMGITSEKPGVREIHLFSECDGHSRLVLRREGFDYS